MTYQGKIRHFWLLILNYGCTPNNAALIKIIENVTLRKDKRNLQNISGHLISPSNTMSFLNGRNFLTLLNQIVFRNLITRNFWKFRQLFLVNL